MQLFFFFLFFFWVLLQGWTDYNYRGRIRVVGMHGFAGPYLSTCGIPKTNSWSAIDDVQATIDVLVCMHSSIAHADSGNPHPLCSL